MRLDLTVLDERQRREYNVQLARAAGLLAVHESCRRVAVGQGSVLKGRVAVVLTDTRVLVTWADGGQSFPLLTLTAECSGPIGGKLTLADAAGSKLKVSFVEPEGSAAKLAEEAMGVTPGTVTRKTRKLREKVAQGAKEDAKRPPALRKYVWRQEWCPCCQEIVWAWRERTTNGFNGLMTVLMPPLGAAVWALEAGVKNMSGLTCTVCGASTSPVATRVPAPPEIAGG